MHKLLVVDDEPKHRRCLAEMIKVLRPEYKVLEAKNGKEALELIESESMDIIITDIRMPIMDGLSFMEFINMKARDTKVIILSGFAYFEYAQKALSLGAFDFVLKPVNEAKVSEILDKVEKEIE
ncbi:MAG TPA: response regulator, partial [Ruminiclostridium sp.]